jgi:hypothetical protein
MSEFFTKAKEQIIIYWLLGFYFILFSLSALSSCLLASLIGSDLKTMDNQGKWMVALAVFGNWSTIMLAFFNKAAGKLAANQLPISPDDTALISRQTVKRTETTSVAISQTPDK